jgi:hypothetical protein
LIILALSRSVTGSSSRTTLRTVHHITNSCRPLKTENISLASSRSPKSGFRILANSNTSQTMLHAKNLPKGLAEIEQLED